MAPNPRRQDAKLDSLYAELPRISCRGLCHDSCGPIFSSLRERMRMEKEAGTELTCGEGATCSMLTEDRRCGVYDVRPLICRLWGVVESMPCPYGCKPEWYLKDSEGFDLIARAEEIGERDRTESLAAIIRVAQAAGVLHDVAKFIQPPTIEGRNVPKTVIERD